MNGFAVFGLVAGAIVVAAAVFIFGVNILVWNINDIIAHGANFWNVFWISLVAVSFTGGSAKAAS